MRRRTRVSIGASVAAVALALSSHSPVFSDAYALTNGDFEGGTTGWAPPVGATLAVDASTASAEGARAAHLTSTGAGLMSLGSKYWESPDPTVFMSYTLAALVRDDDAATSVVTARLSVLNAGEQILSEVAATLGGSDGAAYRTITTAPVIAPTGAKYLRVTFTAQASRAGARFSIDGVTITAAAPATPIPTPEAMPPPPSEELPEPPGSVATPTPTPPPTSTPRATSTPRPSATPRITATPSPTTTPPPPAGTTLRNANFEQGVAGWSVVRGRLTVAPSIEGQGASLVLTADDAATVWIQQTVAVTPGSWSTASALLAPLDGVEAAWLRIAWYASADGGGVQLSTEDSPAVASSAAAPGAMVQAGRYEVVSTGPVQAPLEAHSARIRVLLRAANERGAAVAIDDVTFEAADPTDAAPRPPAPGARTQTTRATTPAPPSREAPSSSPASPATATASTPPRESRASAEGVRFLRITEVMSDPDEPGADGSYEWVEVVNTGPGVVDLAGIILSDRRSGSVLPSYALVPGAVVVVAASGARLPEGTPVVRLPGSIGNSLGNTGDRVALIAADGREIDAVTYGEGAEDGEAALPAPGPGQSLQRFFSPAGIALDARVTDTPTPGVVPLSPTARLAAAAAEPGPAMLGSAADGAPSWAVLAALAGGLLAGAAATYAASIARGRGGGV